MQIRLFEFFLVTMDVYLPLASNSKDFTENTNDSFKVKLETSLKLDGRRHEVGLADIIFPTSWHNMTTGQMAILTTVENSGFFKRKQTKLCIPLGMYTSLEQVLAELAKVVSSSPYPNVVKFESHPIRNAVSVTIQDSAHDQQVVMSDDLCQMLGFKEGRTLLKGVNWGDGSPDITRGHSSLWIYTNLVANRRVVNTSAQLLRIVPVNTLATLQGKRKDAAINYHDFKNIQYVPASDLDTELIEVDIRRDDGTPVAFKGGKVVLNVHIRDKFSHV